MSHEMEKAQKAQIAPLDPAIVARGKEAFSIATTLLLSPRGTGKGGDKAFYAHFLMRMNIEFVNQVGGYPVKTAGVNITDQINFYVNPEFFLSLGYDGCEEQQELIIHEIEHIVYLHPLRGKELLEKSSNQQNDHHLFNLTCDAAINIPLTSLTANHGVTFDRLNEEMKKYKTKLRLSEKDVAETNFWKLRQFQEEQGENLPQNMGQGAGGETDDHGMWGQGECASEEVAKAMVKDATNKAVESTGAGNLPSHIARQVAELNKSVVNWKRELQQFAVRTIKFSREKTRNKLNRRFGIYQQGSRKKPEVKLAVCVDSSGSVGDDAFTQFFAEIEKIVSMGVEITVIDADCSVAAVYDYKKGKGAKRYGNGGTAYQPAITKAKELRVDGIIYFGDMDSADKPKNPGVPFLWCIVGKQSPPADWGRKVYIENEQC